MSRSPAHRIAGVVGAVWGTAGVLTLLGFAIYRLTPKAYHAWQQGLTTTQWLVAAAFFVFMLYSEGYRGFQLRFSPRTAARVRYLHDNPRPLHVLLAPAFSMGFFHATRRVRITAFALTSMIIVLVIAVQQLDQPWRGIVDAGVVAGLTWGIVSFGWYLVRAFGSEEFGASPEVP